MHGVDTDAYAPPADRAAAFAEAKLPGRYAIGCFGRVRAQKGTDVFVEAMCRLLPRYPDFTAIIVGAVVPEQQGLCQRSEAADRGGRPAVAHRHHGRTRNRRSAALVSAADDLRLHLAQRRLWPDADRGDVFRCGAGGGARGRGRIRGRGRRDRRADADRRRRCAGRGAGAADARSGTARAMGRAGADACAGKIQPRCGSGAIAAVYRTRRRERRTQPAASRRQRRRSTRTRRRCRACSDGRSWCRSVRWQGWQGSTGLV